MREFPLISTAEASRGAHGAAGAKAAAESGTAPFAALLVERMAKPKAVEPPTPPGRETAPEPPGTPVASGSAKTQRTEMDGRETTPKAEDQEVAEADSAAATATSADTLMAALDQALNNLPETNPLAQPIPVPTADGHGQAASDDDTAQEALASTLIPSPLLDVSAQPTSVTAVPVTPPQVAGSVLATFVAAQSGTGTSPSSATDALRAQPSDATTLTDTASVATATEVIATLSTDGEASLDGKEDRSQSDFVQLLAHRQREGGIGAQVSHQASVQRAEQSIVLQHPAGESRWQNELGDKLVWMAGAQRQQAELVLNPPQLGRVEVSLTLSGDQANAVFASPNAAVREMLENSLPRLREIMSGAGIQLGDAQISNGNPQQGNASQEGPRNAFRPLLSDTESTPSRLAESPRARILTGRGLVDTFV